MFVCEFQNIRNSQYFGLQRFPDRAAAEAYATTELLRLGEHPDNVASAVAVAGWGCADTSADGYGVRIFDEETGKPS